MICLTPWELHPALTGFECFSWWWALPLLHQPGKVTQSCKICKASTCCIMLHVSWRFTAVLDILLYVGYATDTQLTPLLKEADVQTRRRRLGSTVHDCSPVWVVVQFAVSRCLQIFQSLPVPCRLLEYGFTCCCTRCLAEDSCSKPAAVAVFHGKCFETRRSAAQDSASLRKTQKRLKWCWRCSKSLDVNVMHWTEDMKASWTEDKVWDQRSFPHLVILTAEVLFVKQTHQIWAAEEVFDGALVASTRRTKIAWCIDVPLARKKCRRMQKRSDLDIYWGISGVMIILWYIRITTNR